jgi:TonB family protein
MDTRDLGITIGICASLAVHVGVLTYSANRYAHTPLYYPSSMHRLPGVLVSLKPKQPPPPPDSREDIGEATGTGESNFASLGDRPLQAPKADETQAWYSLQNPGQRTVAKPAGRSDNATVGDNGRGGPRSRAAQALADAVHQIEYPRQPHPTPRQRPDVAKPQQPSPPSPPAAPLALAPSPKPHLILPSTTQPSPRDDLAEAAPSPPVPQLSPPTPTTPDVRTATGDGRQPGAAASAGDPAPHSDTDSDAFSKIGSAVFRNGHVDVRFGRRVKLTRPNLLLSGQWDTFSIDDPTVVLKIFIDTTGKVSHVDIVKSSGSNDIDQPSQVAAYDWWFEPRTDGKGHPVPDVILFTITYR